MLGAKGCSVTKRVRSTKSINRLQVISFGSAWPRPETVELKRSSRVCGLGRVHVAGEVGKVGVGRADGGRGWVVW